MFVFKLVVFVGEFIEFIGREVYLVIGGIDDGFLKADFSDFDVCGVFRRNL